MPIAAFSLAISNREEVARFLVFDARVPRSIAYCLGEIQAMIELLRRNFGLRHASAIAELVEEMMAGLGTASNDEHLLERLHSFNDWVQLSLIHLTDELGRAFFGYARPVEAAPPIVTQSQSQTMTSR